MTEQQTTALAKAAQATHFASPVNPSWRNRRTGRVARASYLPNADWIAYTYGDAWQTSRRVFVTLKRFMEMFDPVDPKETP